MVATFPDSKKTFSLVNRLFRSCLENAANKTI